MPKVIFTPKKYINGFITPPTVCFNMSYIRMNQSGSYISIPNGSLYYLYGEEDGTVGGTPLGEFGGMLFDVCNEVTWTGEPSKDAIYDAFDDYFGGITTDYTFKMLPHERGEVFCQCIDARCDSVELTDDLQTAVQEWADEFERTRICEHCTEEFYPKLYNDDTAYYCKKDECQEQREADIYDVDRHIIHKYNRIYEELYHTYDYSNTDANAHAMNYLFFHCPHKEATLTL